MAVGKADFTNTFRHLANVVHVDTLERSEVRDNFDDPSAFNLWAERWQARLAEDDRAPAVISAAMRQVNPAVIPRNHLVEVAIRAAEDDGDFTPFNRLVDEVIRPFEERDSGSHYVRPPELHEVVHQTFAGPSGLSTDAGGGTLRHLGRLAPARSMIFGGFKCFKFG